MTVAALFVQSSGVYFGLPDVDPWDERRDARLYYGPHPVVAHPPCSRWCLLAPMIEAKYGYKVGDDGGCFAHALASVNRWGGVLEHPAQSRAWKHFGLIRPVRGVWGRSSPGWVTEVSQSTYGHRARKRTWLYLCSAQNKYPPNVDWVEKEPTAQVSYMINHGATALPRLSKKEASKTPIPFRDLLLDLARWTRQ